MQLKTHINGGDVLEKGPGCRSPGEKGVAGNDPANFGEHGGRPAADAAVVGARPQPSQRRGSGRSRRTSGPRAGRALRPPLPGGGGASPPPRRGPEARSILSSPEETVVCVSAVFGGESPMAPSSPPLQIFRVVPAFFARRTAEAPCPPAASVPRGSSLAVGSRRPLPSRPPFAESVLSLFSVFAAACSFRREGIIAEIQGNRRFVSPSQKRDLFLPPMSGGSSIRYINNE